jgi:hypothetical protein
MRRAYAKGEPVMSCAWRAIWLAVQTAAPTLADEAAFTSACTQNDATFQQRFRLALDALSQWIHHKAAPISAAAEPGGERLYPPISLSPVRMATRKPQPSSVRSPPTRANTMRATRPPTTSSSPGEAFAPRSESGRGRRCRVDNGEQSQHGSVRLRQTAIPVGNLNRDRNWVGPERGPFTGRLLSWRVDSHLPVLG